MQATWSKMISFCLRRSLSSFQVEVASAYIPYSSVFDRLATELGDTADCCNAPAIKQLKLNSPTNLLNLKITDITGKGDNLEKGILIELHQMYGSCQGHRSVLDSGVLSYM